MDVQAKASQADVEKTEIHSLLHALYHKYGYDYRDYLYSSIRRRVWHRVYAEQLDSIPELLDKIMQDPECMKRLLADFSIHVTEMFRDPPFFLHFRQHIVPLLRTYPSLRIWHAGCSTGEEVFSMAILLHEEGLLDRCTMYATDINAELLKKAKSGTLPLAHMRRYTSNYIQAGGCCAFSDYYTVEHQRAKLHAYLTKRIVFAKHNLATDRSFNEFHVIICRNVLIYFNRELQERVHELFYNSLPVFGILGLGDKEAISQTRLGSRYESIGDKQKLYRKIQ